MLIFSILAFALSVNGLAQIFDPHRSEEKENLSEEDKNWNDPPYRKKPGKPGNMMRAERHGPGGKMGGRMSENIDLDFAIMAMARNPEFRQMLKLNELNEEQLKAHLQQWPRFQQMGSRQQEEFKEKMHKFRTRAKFIAMRYARENDLYIESERQQEYLVKFWKKRLSIEEEIMSEIEPKRHAMLGAMKEELTSEFAQ
ncbi:MAG: hypothetical protein AAF984_04600 [Verrucomicrobiota bacterium]